MQIFSFGIEGKYFEKFNDVENNIQNLQGTYYFKDGKNMPCGKLYYAYKNTVAKLRKENLFPREKKRKTEKRQNTSSLSQPGKFNSKLY